MQVLLQKVVDCVVHKYTQLQREKVFSCTRKTFAVDLVYDLPFSLTPRS